MEHGYDFVILNSEIPEFVPRSWELHLLNRYTAEIKPKGAVCAVTVVECLCFLFKGWLKFVESVALFS